MAAEVNSFKTFLLCILSKSHVRKTGVLLLRKLLFRHKHLGSVQPPEPEMSLLIEIVLVLFSKCQCCCCCYGWKSKFCCHCPVVVVLLLLLIFLFCCRHKSISLRSGFLFSPFLQFCQSLLSLLPLNPHPPILAVILAVILVVILLVVISSRGTCCTDQKQFLVMSWQW